MANHPEVFSIFRYFHQIEMKGFWILIVFVMVIVHMVRCIEIDQYLLVLVFLCWQTFIHPLNIQCFIYLLLYKNFLS